MIKNFIGETLNFNVPTKTLRSRQSLPWINNDIKALIRRRNRTHATYKRTKGQKVKQKWQNLRSEVNKLVQSVQASLADEYSLQITGTPYLLQPDETPRTTRHTKQPP